MPSPPAPSFTSPAAHLLQLADIYRYNAERLSERAAELLADCDRLQADVRKWEGSAHAYRQAAEQLEPGITSGGPDAADAEPKPEPDPNMAEAFGLGSLNSLHIGGGGPGPAPSHPADIAAAVAEERKRIAKKLDGIGFARAADIVREAGR